MSHPIKTLFLDIGGVLLTNGWDRKARQEAAKLFSLDYTDLEERHHLTYDTYESGKLDLDVYLDRIVFFEKRGFTKEQFRLFMTSQSQPYPETIEYFKKLKKANSLQIGVVSNEGKELSEYRIRKFELNSWVDFFVVSSFVHLRKPDEDIYRLALGIAQVPAEKCAYADDRHLFVEVAQKLGIRSVHHTALSNTSVEFEAMGLSAK
ncbi:MAG TPA: HAD-IA family hydrolase [bacterium]|nr:HAD-IA family hydrolase [bacterium]